jgi:hypothetical protein
VDERVALEDVGPQDVPPDVDGDEEAEDEHRRVLEPSSADADGGLHEDERMDTT